MHLSEESTINLVDCHGEEDGELFLSVENDDQQLQHHPPDICFGCRLTGHFCRACPVSRNSAQGQSAWTELKERSEKLSQLQKSNDKYTYSSSSD